MFKNAFKKSISVILVALLLVSAIPALAFAQSSEETAVQQTSCEVAGCEVEGCTGGCAVQSSAEEVATQEEETEDVIYTVRFFDWDKTTFLGSFEVKEGEASPTPMPPAREGHVFVKWDQDTTNVTSDMTVYASYRQMNSFSVVVQYVFTDGTPAAESKIFTVAETQSFTQEVASPTVAGYTPNHAALQLDIESVTSDMLYTVTYSLSSGTAYTVEHYLEKLESIGSYEDPITETFYGTTGDEILAQENSYPGFNAQSGVRTGTITADGKLTIKIYYNRNHVALYFDSAGGAYKEPLLGRFGEIVDYTGFEPPKRDGYDFKEWDKALPATFPAADLYITALWDEYPKAAITVIHWVENVSTGGYTIVSVDTSMTDLETGSKPDYNSFTPPYTDEEGFIGFPWNGNMTTLDVLLKYFPKNVAKTEAANKDLVVRSDGSTTYNIYYDLATITYRFIFPGTTDNSDKDLVYDGSKVYLEIDGKKYYSGEYSFSCKYTASPSASWPKSSQIKYETAEGDEAADFSPNGWRIGDSLLTYKVTIDITGITAQWLERGHIGNDLNIDFPLSVYPPGTKMASITINNWHQDIGEAKTIPDNFSLAYTDKMVWTAGTTASATPDDGFGSIYVENGVDKGSYYSLPYTEGAVYDVYHYRNKYAVVFMSNDVEVKRIDNIWYEDKISNYEGYDFVPTPLATESNYTFAGWYTSPLFEDSTKVNLSTLEMTPSHLVLYAKWEAPKYPVTFNLNGGQGKDTTQNITSGGYVAPYDEPTRDGYTFAGWYEQDKNVVFRSNVQIVRPYALIAKWIPAQTGEYTVYYRELGSTKDLVAPKTVSGVAIGSSQSAKAAVINGYLPDYTSKSININTQSNTIIFYYKSFSSTTYQVRYETMEGVALLSPVTKVTSASQVTENHIPITGYYPYEAQISLQVSQNTLANVIVFKYIPYSHAAYTVNHFLQALDGSYYFYTSEVLTAERDKYITVAPHSYTGFTYNRSISNPSGVVNLKNTLVLNLYYDRTVHSITFLAEEGGSLEGVDTFPSILNETPFSSAVTVPKPVADDGYTFAGWSPEIPDGASTVTASATYTATFEADDEDEEDEGTTTTTPGVTTTTGGGNDGGGGVVENLANELSRLFAGETPLASFDGSHWSLVNLILSLICIISAIVLFIRSFGRLKKEEDERTQRQSAGAYSASSSEQAEEEDGKRRFNFLRLIAMIVAIIPLILFIIFEDMTLPMALIDQYTIISALLTIAMVVVIGIQMMRNRQRAKEDEHEEDETSVSMNRPDATIA